ncbi:MAG: GNAT family N-acetyltransferase [Microbacterium gubbeenense]|uniref:GNAT family N-acetyltransferase n=1 Tax=Microbacterium gubbeenense TaxID=159896 RepID=UPI003F95C7DD
MISGPDSLHSRPLVEVTLAAVDEQILAKLSAIASSDADADEVTPPLSPGSSWTPQRLEWFEGYHRSRRSGLAGRHREATWAIMNADRPVGSVRLGLTETVGTLETGIWLARTYRGKGIARQAMLLVLDEARRYGAHVVCADTASSNRSAQSLMQSVGFVLGPRSGEGRVQGAHRTV